MGPIRGRVEVGLAGSRAFPVLEEIGLAYYVSQKVQEEVVKKRGNFHITNCLFLIFTDNHFYFQFLDSTTIVSSQNDFH